ncbi:MAG: hypothetical protein EXS31_08690 [Pedosphaera sp.]|nr:hypothetical protein [Pedosphaera sp.]
MKFKLRKVNNHGTVKWLVDLRGIGRGHQFFDTERDAKSFRDVAQSEVPELGVSALDLSSHDRVEFLAAKKQLEVSGASIIEAVCFFLKHSAANLHWGKAP